MHIEITPGQRVSMNMYTHRFIEVQIDIIGEKLCLLSDPV